MQEEEARKQEFLRINYPQGIRRNLQGLTLPEEEVVGERVRRGGDNLPGAAKSGRGTCSLKRSRAEPTKRRAKSALK